MDRLGCRAFWFLDSSNSALVLLGGFGGKAPPAWFVKADSNRTLWRSAVPNSLLAFPNGPAWQRAKRTVAPLFSAKSLDRALPMVHRCSAQLVRALKQAGAGTEISMNEFAAAWSLDVIGQVAFGHDFAAVASHARGEPNEFGEGAGAIMKYLLRKYMMGDCLIHIFGRAHVRAFAQANQLYRSTAERVIAAVEAELETVSDASRDGAAASTAADASRSFLASLVRRTTTSTRAR